MGGWYEGRHQTIIDFDHSRFCGPLRSLIFVLNTKEGHSRALKGVCVTCFHVCFEKMIVDAIWRMIWKGESG